MNLGYIFSGIVNNIESIISHGGYTLLFIFTILEGLPVLGMVVPGHIAIIAGGFLARIGSLDLSFVITISLIGAIFGDYIGFYLGRKYGISFIDKVRKYFLITDLHIDKVRNLIDKHTGKAMIMGRFTPATRCLMPFIVGTMHTPVKRFWLFNIIGAVSWVVSSIMVGYIFGAGYHLAAGYFGKFSIIAVIVTLIIFWGYRFVNKNFHIFKRYELITLALNIISLWIFAVIIEKLSDQAFKLGFDVWVSGFMCTLVHPIGACLGSITPESPLSYSGTIIVNIAYWFTTIGSTAVMSSLGVFIGIWFITRKKWRSAAILLLSTFSTAFIILLLKHLFSISRPEFALQYIANDPSFPSGHAGMAAVFFTVIAYLSAPKIYSWIKRELMIVVCVLMIILIGLSRLVLNVHWASDVIAGWALGVFMATASILIIRYISSILIGKDVSLEKTNKIIYKLVLIRHGESVWNKENKFAGWVDVDLTEKGIDEAHTAGKALREAGFHFDVAFTSLLQRANKTLDIVLEELGQKNIEIRRSWKLNERHYGALQGMNKSEMALKYGEDQVKKWRRGYDVSIPPIDKESDMYPGKDPLYSSLCEAEIPLSENLKMVVERVVPYWNNEIMPSIKAGKMVIIAASGNSLRALAKYIEKISDSDIVEYNFPTGIPLVYELDVDLNLINKYFLADTETLNKALATVANQGKAK